MSKSATRLFHSPGDSYSESSGYCSGEFSMANFVFLNNGIFFHSIIMIWPKDFSALLRLSDVWSSIRAEKPSSSSTHLLLVFFLPPPCLSSDIYSTVPLIIQPTPFSTFSFLFMSTRFKDKYKFQDGKQPKPEIHI